MSFTRSKKESLVLRTNFNQYVMASTYYSNVPLVEPSFESIIVLKIVEYIVEGINEKFNWKNNQTSPK